MFVLSKLRAVAAGAASCLLLLAGLGLVAGSSLRANPDEKPDPPAAPAGKAAPKADPKAAESDDAKFLRRTSLDLRGTLPTTIEMRYFLADRDPKKRTKVVEWMVTEHGAQKVTATCLKCHQAAMFHDQVHHFHLGVFDDPKGAAWTDVDKDGKVDLFLEMYKPPVTTPDEYARFVKRVLGLPGLDPGPEVQNARLAAERAEAEVTRADAALRVAEERDKEGKAGARPPDVTQAELEQARAALVAARANQKLAEAQLAQAESSWLSLVQTRRKGQPAADPERVAKDNDERLRSYYLRLRLLTGQPDVEFLRRLSRDVRGTPPTRVEENYFQADKDPNKREKLMQLLLAEVRKAPGHGKLIEDLLADPEVQKRWMAIWKERLAAEEKAAARKKALGEWVTKGPADRLDRLLGQLLAARKSDDQILDALCLATLARFPTDTERMLILDTLRGQSDKRAAWGAVLKVLASTQEARAHADGLSKRVAK